MRISSGVTLKPPVPAASTAAASSAWEASAKRRLGGAAARAASEAWLKFKDRVEREEVEESEKFLNSEQIVLCRVSLCLSVVSSPSWFQSKARLRSYLENKRLGVRRRRRGAFDVAAAALVHRRRCRERLTSDASATARSRRNNSWPRRGGAPCRGSRVVRVLR